MNAWTERAPIESVAPILAAARAAGRVADDDTALVFHDLDRMRDRIGELRGAFPAGALHAVAVKANPLVEVLRHCVEAGAGLECASMEEVALSLAAGCPPDQVVFDSPAKTPQELAHALDLGVVLNLDNFEELARVARLRAAMPECAATVGLRINPMVGTGSISMTSVAGRLSKFGVPILGHESDVVQAFADHPWLEGLHVHVGSQGCGTELLAKGIERALAIRAQIEAELGAGRVKWIDGGGGLPVQYLQGDTPPSLEEYAKVLRRDASGLWGPGAPRLLTEFGRAIQAGCGWAISRVEYVKQEGEDRMAVIHLGADFLMRRVYRPEDWKHEFVVLDADGHPKSGPTRAWSLAGPLCFGGDIVLRDAPLPDPAVGDLVLVRDVGAYTMSMWSRHCSRGLPKVLGYRSGVGGDPQLSLLRRREGPQDVVRFWSAEGC